MDRLAPDFLQNRSVGAAAFILAGEMAFVPRNEWHGFRNTGAAPVLAFFGYLGVGARIEAGYQVMTTSH